VPGTRWLRMTLTEGRKREVRVLCAGAGLRVLRLIRIRFGPLLLGDLPAGSTRPLTATEIWSLQELLDESAGGSDQGSEA
jgi:16S rRNA U516 pseudouridylate synthase RsuA-like enzyme